MNKQQHKEHHIHLHQALDDLVSDYITHTGKGPSETTILQLMEWSNRRVQSPDATEMDEGENGYADDRHLANADVVDAFNADDHVANEGGEAPADLGPCCCCEESGPTVRNIIMLNKKAPIPGRGWGCVVCHLPNDGAVAVVCDRCLREHRPYRFACRGFPANDGRIPIGELTGAHEHDMSKHPEEARHEHN